jgi:hypothetical protein
MQMAEEEQLVWHKRAALSTAEWTAHISRLVKTYRPVAKMGSDNYWNELTCSDALTHLVELLPARGFAAVAANLSTRTHKTVETLSTWYLWQICGTGRGAGRTLLCAVESAAIEAGAHWITMAALPYVMQWYYRRGYTMGRGGGEDRAVAASNSKDEQRLWALLEKGFRKPYACPRSALTKRSRLWPILRYAVQVDCVTNLGVPPPWCSDVTLSKKCRRHGVLVARVEDGVYMAKHLAS